MAAPIHARLLASMGGGRVAAPAESAKEEGGPEGSRKRGHSAIAADTSAKRSLANHYSRERATHIPAAAPAARVCAGSPREQLQGALSRLSLYQQQMFPRTPSSSATPAAEPLSGQFPLSWEPLPGAESTVATLHLRAAGTCSWVIALCPVSQRRSTQPTLRINAVVAAGPDEEVGEYCAGWRSKYAVFSQLSDSAASAAVHYGQLHAHDPPVILLHLLVRHAAPSTRLRAR